MEPLIVDTPKLPLSKGHVAILKFPFPIVIVHLLPLRRGQPLYRGQRQLVPCREAPLYKGQRTHPQLVPCREAPLYKGQRTHPQLIPCKEAPLHSSWFLFQKHFEEHTRACFEASVQPGKGTDPPFFPRDCNHRSYVDITCRNLLLCLQTNFHKGIGVTREVYFAKTELFFYM